jgi:hypothetical protein
MFFYPCELKILFGEQLSLSLKDFEMQQQYFDKKNYCFIKILLYLFIAILLVEIARLTRA